MKRFTLPFWLLVALVVLILVSTMSFDSGTAAADVPPSPDPALDEPGSPIVTTNLAQLPLSFVPNAGQADPAVRFQAHTMGGTVHFAPQEVAFSLPSPAQAASHPDPRRGRPAQLPAPGAPGGRAPDRAAVPSVVQLRFEGGTPPSEIAATDPLPGVANYFLGNDPARWHTNLPTFAGIVYRGVYPGIDVHYEGSDNHLKSTYVVAPGADLGRIRWRYHGAAAGHVDQNGNFHVTLPVSATDAPQPPAAGAPQALELIEHTPAAWQEINGQRVEVSVAYALNADGTTGFQVGAYDPTFPLVLDPTLTYSTYLGGSDYDEGLGVAVDADGSAYIVGKTVSTTFPKTLAYDATHNGGYDVFVTKLNPRGMGRVYSTYLGGTWTDIGFDIEVDSSAYAYIVGITNSDVDFPRVNALQPNHGGLYDAFVTKLDPSGGSLVYSTFLGGSGYEYGLAIEALMGRAYVAGYTQSLADFPRLNAAQPNFGGGPYDAFVTKLSLSGTALSYSTFLGGNGWDMAWDLAVNGSGNAFVAGYTDSVNGFPTPNALQAGNAGGYDAFVTKLSVAGDAFNYSTYLGGSGNETALGVTLDGSGNVYVAGSTTSSETFPRVNASQPDFGGVRDAFVTKLNSALSAYSYSTFLGGSGEEEASGVAVDKWGYATITGYTSSSTDFPVANALYATYRGGGKDAFVTTYNTRGNKLLHSTYLGGSADEVGNGVSVDQWGNIYVSGYTSSSNFTRANPMDNTYNGAFDAYVSKIEVPSTVMNWFNKRPTHEPPGAYPPARTVAQRSDVVILTKSPKELEYLTDLREYGFHGIELQYVLSNEVNSTASDNQWAYLPTDWDNQIDPNDDWFLYKRLNDGTYVRLETRPGSGIYHMDPSHDGWRQFVKSRAQLFITDGDAERGDFNYDGFFLDNVHLTMEKTVQKSAGGAAPWKRRGTTWTQYSESAYTSEFVEFVGEIRKAVDEVKPSAYLYGNMIGDTYSGSSWNQFMVTPAATNVPGGDLDGGMFENWVTGYCPPPPTPAPTAGPSPTPGGPTPTPARECDSPTTHTLDPAKQTGVLTQAQWLVARGKRFIAVGQGLHPNVASDAQRQRFALASYLLVVPAQNRAQAVFRYSNSDDVTGDAVIEYRDWWHYDNFDSVRLGAPVGTAYRPNPATQPNVWRRDFVNGYVRVDQTVNLTATPYTFPVATIIVNPTTTPVP